MPLLPARLLLVALHLGAKPRDVLTPARLLAFVVARADLISEHDLGGVLGAFSSASEGAAIAAVNEDPIAFGSLLNSAVVASRLPRALALARLVAGLPLVPIGANEGIVLHPPLRPRLGATLAFHGDRLVLAERGRPWVAVEATDADEYRVLLAAAQRRCSVSRVGKGKARGRGGASLS